MDRIRIIFLILATALTVNAVTSVNKGKQVKDKTVSYTFQKGDDYESLWATVDSLEKKGLPRSAMEVVNKIYSMAEQDDNGPQMIKAIIYIMKYNMYLEEDDFVIAVNRLNGMVAKAKEPQKQFLHSVIAQVFVNYYNQNRYKFYNRTTTVNFRNDDIRTWDLKHISLEVIRHYLLSLDNRELLQQIPVENYKDVMREYSINRVFRPTLFDFLAHRAIDFFKTTEFDVTRPGKTFSVAEEKYFFPAEAFSKIDIKTEDSLATRYYAMIILRELTKFHVNDKDPAALVDLELHRLQLVRSWSVLPEKDTLYYLALNKLKNKYSDHYMSGEVNYYIAAVHKEIGDQYNPSESETHKWEKRRSLEICEKVIADHPGTRGADMCRSLKSELLRKELNLTLEEVVSISTPSELIIRSRNVDKLWFRLVEPGWEFFQKDYNDNLLKKLLNLKVEKEWEQDLKTDGDLQVHSFSKILEGLPNGYYTVIAGTSPDFSIKENAVAYASFGVSNLSYVQRRTENNFGYEFTVLDRVTGDARPGVKAQIYTRDYNYMFSRYEYKKAESYTTDAAGKFTIQSTNKDYRYFYVDLTSGTDRLNATQSYYQYKKYNQSKQTRYHTYFFLDRAIYRPGQTVHFKGIHISTDPEGNPDIAAGKPLTITFYDHNSQMVSSLDLVTNDFGTVSGTFTAPQGGITGTMRITDNYGSKYFSVEEYKRPRFEVDFKPVQGSYKLNEKIKVRGTAKAFAGSSVDGAKVNYRVTRSVYYPWRYYGWGITYPYGQQAEIISGTSVTDETGNFTIEFIAAPDPSVSKKYRPAFSYTVTVDITDINGETRSGTMSVSAGYQSMLITSNLPSEVNQDKRAVYSLQTENLNGEPVPAKGTWSVYKLQQPETPYRSRKLPVADRYDYTPNEFKEKFPFDYLNKEPDKTTWTRTKKVQEEKFDSEKKDSIRFKNLKSWEPGEYVMEIIAPDSFGIEVKEAIYFSLYTPKAGPMEFAESFWLTEQKIVCEPGEKAQFILGSRLQGSKVYAEFEHKGKIIRREEIILSNEKKILEFPVEEKHRGNLSVHFVFVRNNRIHTHNSTIVVPYTNKEVDVEFSTFRNKILPGAKEEWSLHLKGKKGEKVAAEMLLTMYDASLDAFSANSFYFFPHPYSYSSMYLSEGYGFSTVNSYLMQEDWNSYSYFPSRYYDQLNWFGYYAYHNNYYYRYNDNEGYFATESKSMDVPMVMDGLGGAEKMAEMAESEVTISGKTSKKDRSLQTITTGGDADLMNDESGIISGNNRDKNEGKESLNGVKARSNLSETAFFYPELRTDENGNIKVSFTAPEALTKWKVLGLAHTKDLMIGTVQKELVTQKDLMVIPNVPRFLREGDRIILSAKISNISEKDLEGKAQLFLFDAITQKPLDQQFSNADAQKNFSVKKGLSSAVSWEIKVPEGVQAVTWRIVAKAGSFSDGEEAALPVLTNRMLVTESLPLPVRKAGTKNFTFNKLLNSGNSSTMRHHKLTLEFTSNPAWYAVQALPYMMEYPYECAEQIFSRYYANAIAHNIITSSPKIKAVFESWKQSSPEAFLSNLEKNEELKSLVLEETPWVLEAKDESERKKRIALLFDFNRMSNELSSAMKKLQKMQVYSGGWPWFPGMPESRYITQHIITGMGHLDKLGIKNVREDRSVWNMVEKGVGFLDKKLVEDYHYIKKHYKDYKDHQHISYNVIQYLYARSYFRDIKINGDLKEALEYYSDQSKKYWLNFNIYAQGMLALASNRFEEKTLAADIVNSIREKSITHDEMGMYWKEFDAGIYWYEAPIESQALMIEMFDEVANDQKSVEEAKVWLLKNKQTNDWKTTKATAEACYALLLRGTSILETEDDVEIKVADEIIDPEKMNSKKEAGTGYFKVSWSGNEIKPEMGKVSVTKKTNTVSWGALYWQYFEQLDKITPHETPLKLHKKLFLVKNTQSGPEMEPVTDEVKLQPGDRIRVRIELHVDRAMEYVHMKDMRASGFEPENVFSRYKWQDGLGYYESTRDAATNFFFDYLPKGVHVFEYNLRVAHKGDFSNGITTVQCMYAPEFTSHSEGIRVQVKD